MVLLRNAAAAALLAVTGPACAQNLSNGQPLQFNYEYHCNGERIAVGHCRDNDPASYCQVYYPDRTPAHPGYQVMKAEQLGDVLARLSACASSASAQTASAKPQNGVHVDATRSPGLGPAAWQLLEFDKNSAFYFSRTKLTRSGNTAQGWFTDVLSVPRNFQQLDVSGVQFMQILYWADCTNNSYAIREIAWYDANRKLIPASTQMDASPSFKDAGRGTTTQHLVNVLCRRPQLLADNGPLNGDGDFLVADYLKRLNHPSGALPAKAARAGGTAAKTAAAGTAAVAVPGLGKQSWLLLYINDDVAIFFTAAGLKRSAALPDGWFTEVFTDDQNFGSGISGVEFLQGRYQADCGSSAIKMLQFAAYDIHRKLLTKGSVPDPAFAPPKPNSDQDQILALLCGTKKVGMTEPFVGDGLDLFGLYYNLQKAREKEGH